MIILDTLKINGYQVPNIVETGITYVAIKGESVTCLDGITYTEKIGTKRVIRIMVGELTPNELLELRSHLSDEPIIEFRESSTNILTTATFLSDDPSEISIRHWRNNINYYGSFTLTFTEKGLMP